MSNFKPIETQEELDRIISERLARQKKNMLIMIRLKRVFQSWRKKMVY